MDTIIVEDRQKGFKRAQMGILYAPDLHRNSLQMGLRAKIKSTNIKVKVKVNIKHTKAKVKVNANMKPTKGL